MRPALLLSLALTAGAACATPALADDFATLAGALNVAHKAGDYAAMEADADKLLALRPGYPRLEYLLAVARMERGDQAGALKALGRVADAGMYVDLARAKDFAAVAASPGFQAITARFAALLTPVTHVQPGFKLKAVDFIPEGIAYDPGSGDFFLASVHLREIVRVHDGQESPFADRSAGLWSVLGIKADSAHGALWAVTSALPQMQDYDPSLAGKSALLRFDLKSGALQASYPTPSDGLEHQLNDLTVGPDGSVYAADGDGGVYVLAPEGKDLNPLTAPASLESSQGLAVSPDGRYLYIADYERGLYAYEFASRRLLRLKTTDKLSPYYVDGMVLHGRDLLTVQNAVDPQRIVRFHLDATGLALTDAEVLDSADLQLPEPTLATLVGDKLYIVANSQWSRFDDQGKLAPLDQLQAPSIVELPLK